MESIEFEMRLGDPRAEVLGEPVEQRLVALVEDALQPHLDPWHAWGMGVSGMPAAAAGC